MSGSRVPVQCNLVLIGGRGCGKSSVSKRIARANRNFMLFSVDALIRYEAEGRTIPGIVEDEGWLAFREREFDVLAKLARFESGALVDCGGGAVVDLDESGAEVASKRKRAALRRHGLVVYLRRDVEYLIDRVGNDPDRPALSDTASFREIMARREPWYRDVADHVIDCTGLSKIEVVDRVLDWFYVAQEKHRPR